MKKSIKRLLEIWVLLILIILPTLYADYMTSSPQILELEISSEIDVSQTSSAGKISYANVNLSYIPRTDYRQEVLSISPKPIGENILYSFDTFGTHKILAKSEIKTQIIKPHITKKINFPIKKTEGLEKYLKSSPILDSENPEIIRQAGKIVEGETDLYNAVFLIALWVRKEVTYNLSTFTKEASQPASWVLENKYGVCDEITTLFIALCRAVGIPARFMSGVAYTNFENLDDWGPHAWAEVYFPDFGWVPFDITYSQFGYVDATHISLRESSDANSSSVKYEWKGKDISVVPSPLKINVNPSFMGEKINEMVQIELNAIRKEVGFNSYNLIETTIKNLAPYYQVYYIQYAKVENINIPNLEEMIILKPNQEKKLYQIISLIGDFEDGYQYTLPLFIQLENQSYESTFEAQKNFPNYSLEEMEELKKKLEEPSSKNLITNAELVCEPLKEFYYEYETPTIECELTNLGNTLIKSSLCLDSCQPIELAITGEKRINLTPQLNGTGEKDLIISFGGEKEHITLSLFDKPKLLIKKIEYPKEVTFKEEFTISVDLKKESYSDVKNLTVLFLNKEEQLSEMHALEADELSTYQLNMIGRMIGSKEGELTIKVLYHDLNGKEYTKTQEIQINLKDLTIIDKIILFLDKVDKWIAGLID